MNGCFLQRFKNQNEEQKLLYIASSDRISETLGYTFGKKQKFTQDTFCNDNFFVRNHIFL